MKDDALKIIREKVGNLSHHNVYLFDQKSEKDYQDVLCAYLEQGYRYFYFIMHKDYIWSVYLRKFQDEHQDYDFNFDVVRPQYFIHNETDDVIHRDDSLCIIDEDLLYTSPNETFMPVVFDKLKNTTVASFVYTRPSHMHNFYNMMKINGNSIDLQTFRERYYKDLQDMSQNIITFSLYETIILFDSRHNVFNKKYLHEDAMQEVIDEIAQITGYRYTMAYLNTGVEDCY